MSNIDDAVRELKKLSEVEQEIVAKAIMDFARSAHGSQLIDEQVAEVERRLAETRPTFVTLEEARARLGVL